ncbi:MAG: phage baseplate assembly protein V, partial [Chloroflexota bacterium]|nr:phage baseplate assembly protein V [Chloroflexota bacterium]
LCQPQTGAGPVHTAFQDNQRRFGRTETESGASVMPTFYGKYRGLVTNNQDPLYMGRIRAHVPDVMGEENESGWALPSAPFGGSGMGFFALPKVGAGVWIEFEQGDPDYPIWSGCWWSSKEQVPDILYTNPEKKVLIKSELGHSILLDDTDSKQITLQTPGKQKLVLEDGEGGGQITLQTANGQKIVLTDAEGGQITIQTSGGQKVVLTDVGQITIQTTAGQKVVLQEAIIQIDNATGATLELSGPKIDMNHAALEVM